MRVSRHGARLIRSGVALVIAACALFAGAAPASADIRAVYRNRAGAALTIEVAANGDARADFDGQPFYILVHDRIGYVVYRAPAPVYAASIPDLQALVAERISSVTLPQTNVSDLVERGTATVSGHTGRALYLSEIPADAPVGPVLVFSDEPELAPISAPLAADLAFSIATVQAAGRAIPQAVTMILQQLQRGAPLVFLGYSLESLGHDPIAPDRLAFPATPLTRDQLRNRMTETGR